MNKLSVLLLLVVAFLIPSVALAETIGLVLPPFFDYLVEHVSEEAEKLGVEVIVSGSSNWDVMEQLQSIEALIAQKKVYGLLVYPMDPSALVDVVKYAEGEGIPVATIGQKVEGAFVHVGADNTEGGRVAAHYLIEKLGGKGNIVMIEGSVESKINEEQKQGFKEIMDQHKEMNVVASQSGKWERALAMHVMEAVLQAYPNIDGVFAANDQMIMGAIYAMEAARVNSRVVTIGYGAGYGGSYDELFTYIDEGKLDATIEDFPGEQARKGLQFLVDFIREGKEPPSKEEYITPVVVTKRGEEERSYYWP